MDGFTSSNIWQCRRLIFVAPSRRFCVRVPKDTGIFQSLPWCVNLTFEFTHAQYLQYVELTTNMLARLLELAPLHAPLGWGVGG